MAGDPTPALTPPTTHDYATRRGWGHDYTFTPIDGGQRGHAMGWGYGLKDGDYILLRDRESPNGSSRYRLEHVEYFLDPGDMWKADLAFAPRVRCGDCNAIMEPVDAERHRCALLPPETP